MTMTFERLCELRICGTRIRLYTDHLGYVRAIVLWDPVAIGQVAADEIPAIRDGIALRPHEVEELLRLGAEDYRDVAA